MWLLIDIFRVDIPFYYLFFVCFLCFLFSLFCLFKDCLSILVIYLIYLNVLLYLCVCIYIYFGDCTRAYLIYTFHSPLRISILLLWWKCRNYHHIDPLTLSPFAIFVCVTFTYFENSISVIYFLLSSAKHKELKDNSLLHLYPDIYNFCCFWYSKFSSGRYHVFLLSEELPLVIWAVYWLGIP